MVQFLAVSTTTDKIRTGTIAFDYVRLMKRTSKREMRCFAICDEEVKKKERTRRIDKIMKRANKRSPLLFIISLIQICH